jgi:hypothetical protein
MSAMARCLSAHSVAPLLVAVVAGGVAPAATAESGWTEVDVERSRLDLTATTWSPQKFLTARNAQGTKDYVILPEGHVQLEVMKPGRGWPNRDPEVLKGALKIHAEASNVAIDLDDVAFEQASADLGPLLYAVYPSQGWTCVGFAINAGAQVKLKGDQGTNSLITGEFCQQGERPDIAAEVLPQIRKIHTRQP